jgi:hypothetical protein
VSGAAQQEGGGAGALARLLPLLLLQTVNTLFRFLT